MCIVAASFAQKFFSSLHRGQSPAWLDILAA
jgi:hypothetical protein